MSKYLLVEHNDSGGPIVTIFDNVADRAKATREAILGPDDKESNCPDLLTLAEEGSIRYEGDPGLDWIDALEVRDESNDLRAKLAAAEAEIKETQEHFRKCKHDLVLAKGELSALREDRARLDWLDLRPHGETWLGYDSGQGYTLRQHGPASSIRGFKTVRQAIDAARNK